MVDGLTKKVILTCLVAAFGVQTALVYTDERQDPLSDIELRGRALWHENACQVCHQIYGQGGFLGPDLTNVASRLDDSRLGSLLTVGSGQMPAYRFGPEEVDDLSAYLGALDRPELGRGQLRLGTETEGSGPWGAFDVVLANALEEAPSGVAEGYQAFKARPCTACHTPLSDSPVGAPDLSTVSGRLALADLREVLMRGRPEVGMPPPAPPFEASEVEDVIEFLAWLAVSRDDLEAGLASSGAPGIDWRRLPWWEFR
jgi:nitric oxide reductase subunit C